MARGSRPVNLAKARAERANDAREWTPVDLLRDALARVESGEIKPTQIALYMIEEDETIWRPHCTVAGMTKGEHVALLELMKANALDALRGRE
jgi:hypothetical protein